MRFVFSSLIGMLSLLVNLTVCYAQAPTNFNQAVSESEKLVFNDQQNVPAAQRLKKMLDIVNFVKAEIDKQEVGALGSGGAESVVSSSPASSSSTVGNGCVTPAEYECVPRVVCRRGLFGCFSREKIVWELVPVDKKKTAKEVQEARTILGKHALQLIVSIKNAQGGTVPPNEDKLNELSRQVYGLAVIAKEPFLPGSTK